MEPDALRGARRAGPQFPRPVTRLASLPQRVAAAKRRLRSAQRQGRLPISALIGPGAAEVPLRFAPRGRPSRLRVRPSAGPLT